MLPAGSVERSEPNFDPFRSAFPKPQSGKREDVCAHPKALRAVQNIMTMKRPTDGTDRRKELPMLCLMLKEGEYLTIGEDIVVQVFRIPSPGSVWQSKHPGT